MRSSRPPLRPAAPTAFQFIASNRVDSTERDCFEASSILRKTSNDNATYAERNRSASCPRLYGSLAPSRLCRPFLPSASTMTALASPRAGF